MSYYRNYRRPHYDRRRRRQTDLLAALIMIGALFLLGLFSMLRSIFTSLYFYILLVIGMIVYFWLKRRKKKVVQTEDGINNQEINSEKHGCKCYMDGLNSGEQEVATLLSRELSYKDYFLFNNIILPSENNVSTQIDHLVVSKFGLFVIECKDYKGWIFGDKNQDSWTQSLPGGKNKFSFQNPIRQNFAHIMALKSLLPVIAENLYGIVVFTDKSEFKTPVIDNVVNLSGLIGCIKKYGEVKVTDNDPQLAIGRLSFLCQTLDISAAEHVVNLQAHHK